MRLDEAESAFRAAAKDRFRFTPPEVRRAMIVSDLAGEALEDHGKAVRELLAVLGDVEWLDLGSNEWKEVDEVLAREEKEEPDLLVAYRNLGNRAWQFPFSLGSVLDVLTQKAKAPVLIVPNPHEVDLARWRGSGTDSVMVVADHLAGDDGLVSWGARLTSEGGTLRLTHVEDDRTFERTMSAIARIPSIDTDNARDKIPKQLLHEASDFIESCRAALAEAMPSIRVENIVRMGHRTSDYAALVHEHRVDVLVFHGRDEDQVAMHGAAYPLAVALRHTPLLLA